MTPTALSGRGFRHSTLIAAVWGFFVFAAMAATPNFPALTGRVVDNADLLSAAAERRLTTLLEAHEKATSNQIVVVTVTSLDGIPIEDYGYQLGRHWGLGQKGRDNGALLIVAPNEREVRIEVGYGLEGTLTDVQAHLIVQNAVLPSFRAGQFEAGIVAGAEALLGTIEGTYEPVPQSGERVSGGEHVLSIGFVLLAFGQVLAALLRSRTRSAVVLGGIGFLVGWALVSMAIGVGLGIGVAVIHAIMGASAGRSFGGPRRGGWGGGGFGGGRGGGFSGGGGSFGGGGASGRW